MTDAFWRNLTHARPVAVLADDTEFRVVDNPNAVLPAVSVSKKTTAGAMAVYIASVAVGAILSSMLPTNIGSVNAAAYVSDANTAAILGRRILVSKPGRYVIGAVAISSINHDIECAPGVTFAADASLHTATGLMFTATSCTTTLTNFTVDGEYNTSAVWRSDSGTFVTKGIRITNVGLADTLATIGTYGILTKNCSYVHIDGYYGRRLIGRKDGVFGQNPGKVNFYLPYQCDTVIFENCDLEDAAGEDCDQLHIIDFRSPSLARKSNIFIRKNRFALVATQRRAIKGQGSNVLIEGNSFVKSSLFIPQSPGAMHATVTGITLSSTSPVVITATSHGFVNGQTVTFTLVGGTTELNGVNFTVATATTNTFELSGTDSSLFTAWTAGGEIRRVWAVTGLTQASPPVVTVVAHGLVNSGQVTFAGLGGMVELNTHPVSLVTQANPAVVTSVAHGLTNGQRVMMTNVKGMVELNGNVYTVAGATTDTFQLSGVNSSAFGAYLYPGGEARRSVAITGITKANPAVVTATAHGYVNGQRVKISGVGGMEDINDIEASIAGVTANTFQLVGLNSAGFGTFTTGGEATLLPYHRIAAITADTFTLPDLDSSAFTAWTSGGTLQRVTDIGEQCLNMIDVAGTFEGEFRIVNNFIDATGFPFAITHSAGPLGKTIAKNNRIVCSKLLGYRNNPESLTTTQSLSCSAFFTIAGTNPTFSSEFIGNTVIGGVIALTPQGSRNIIEDNTLDDPSALWINAGGTAANVGLTIKRNRVITRTPGDMSVSRMGLIGNYSLLQCDDNWLDEIGNTTHAAVFCETSNAATTGFARNNAPMPAGTVGFKTLSSNVIVSCSQGTPCSPIVNAVSIGNSTTAETDLRSFAIPAGTLSWGTGTVVTVSTPTNECIHFRWVWSGINSASTKTLRFKVGGTTIATLVLTAAQASVGYADLYLYSTGLSAQRYEFFARDVGTAVVEAAAIGDLTEISAATLTVKATGQASGASPATNDIVCKAAFATSLYGRVLSM